MDKTPTHINPAAITPEMLAKMLNIHPSIIRKHVEMGAPVAPDGTINLIIYVAWLNSRIYGN
jgi:hypothetical protein